MVCTLGGWWRQVVAVELLMICLLDSTQWCLNFWKLVRAMTALQEARTTAFSFENAM